VCGAAAAFERYAEDDKSSRGASWWPRLPASFEETLVDRPRG